MRRLSHVLSAFALVVLGLLALAPVAGAAMPPEGSWSWSQPYVPAAGPHAFRAVTGGTGFSFYTLGDDWSSQWVVNRVDTAADSEGSTDWTQTSLGPTGSTGAEASFLATDSKQNLYVLGTDTTHGGDIYLVKYKGSDGTVLWQKSWDGPAHLADAPHALVVSGGGNVFVAGAIGKAGGKNDAVLLKYDTAGRLKWKYVVSSALEDSFEAVALDFRGNAYVTGRRNAEVGVSTMITLKVDPYGHRVWQRSFSGLGISYAGAFIKVKGSAVYAGGTLYKRENWPVVAKYSLTGKRVWAWTPVGGGVNTVDDMTVDAQGRVVLVGVSDTWVGGGPLTTAWVYMLAADGSSVAQSTTCYADYGATQYPVIFHDVALDGSGNIYLAGEWQTSMGGTEGNALVARIPSPDTVGSTFEMEKIWRLDGPASGVDQFWGLLLQPGNGFYAVGTEHTGLGWQAVAHRLNP